MNDAPGSYDRLMEKMVADLQADVVKLEGRMLKLELWRNTILVIFTTLVFAAGASARDLVALLKHVAG